jgi:uncharacterized repeat protein (TIGR03806 family)
MLFRLLTGLWIAAALPASAWPENLRVANSTINVPAQAPATSISLVNAFPGLPFASPVCIVSPPGEQQRLFVCEKGGLLKVIPDVTAPSPVATTFLNLPGILSSRGESLNSSGECGLLGLAFHPDFATNRQFYVFYSVNSGGLRQRVSRFRTIAGNPNSADASSELILIDQADGANNHNGGDLHFGPDGYLYISVGDEGGANDAYNNSQIITKNLFAGILRIDVDKKPDNVPPTPHAAIPLTAGAARFSIPKDNPFVHTSLGGRWDGTFLGNPVSQIAVRREFFAVGLRNPWRMSFDPLTGELWCADVGQGAREEINLIENGGNYGWAFREGTLGGAKSGQAPAGFDSAHHRGPLYEYSHGTGLFNGRSVSGGLVYRGNRISRLHGKYIFGDYVTGNLWALDRNQGGRPLVERIAGEGGIVAFGSDPSNGDVLVADLNDNRILRIVSTPAVGTFPQTLTATGLFQNTAALTPAPGMVPYEVNLPFWSDHALKRRWFMVPDGVSRFGWQREGAWTLPDGALWVKHFDMEMEPGNPASARRLETRLLVKIPRGAYGVSYRWNEAGTEASLAADEGETIALPGSRSWRIPSRADCMTCHTPQAGHALSFNTRQLNLDRPILTHAGNQIDILHAQGFFSNPPESSNLLPRHLRPDEEQASMEARVRSYLAVNCAYCHMDGGTTPGDWDVRAELTLGQTGLLHGPVRNDGGNPSNRLLVPGKPENSVLLHRIAGTAGFTRMPPIASEVVDQENVALIHQWIGGELAARQSYADWRLANFGSPDSPSGAPAADADADGADNHAEFLAGTDPLDATRAPRPRLSAADGLLTLAIDLPVNRSFVVETSGNLSDWSAWDVPGNSGLPRAGGTAQLTGPLADPLKFFRVRISGN